MDKTNIIKSIEEAKAKFLDSHDQGVIDGWYSEAKRLLFLDDLKGHKGVKLILETFTKDIEDINLLLIEATSFMMCDRNRDLLIEKRNMYRKFVGLFQDADKGLENIKSEMDNLV